ncbi:MAG: undecaprenyl-diphosphate phosphatase [Planctomycetota bacterium]
MSELTYLEALVLGVIQGLTEFLPVSSSAHLAFTQRWMGLQADSPSMFMFDGLSHVGTLVSVAVVFRESIGRFAVQFIRECSAHWTGRRNAWRIALLGMVASVPTAVIGLGFKEQLEADFGRPRWIGAELIFTGFLLATMVFLPRGRRGLKKFVWWQAALIGAAQGAAIVPGISRSGATICTASFFGLRRRWAAEFSFFIAFPAILGATAIQFKDLLAQGGAAMGQLPWGPIVMGSLVSLLIGILSLELLVQAVMRAKLHYFAVYCWLLGGLVLAGLI